MLATRWFRYRSHVLRPDSRRLGPELAVHSAYNGYWYWAQPTIDELRRDFRALTRAVRPDWEPAAPATKAPPVKRPDPGSS